eukprot:jgi/Mesvir1/1341/Mv16888-RA.1
MASQYVFQNSATQSNEVLGREWEPELDFNVNYPRDAFPDYVALGGRLDPSVESTRIRGGIDAVNQNRSMYIDDRVLAPYANLYWDELKRGDRPTKNVCYMYKATYHVSRDVRGGGGRVLAPTAALPQYAPLGPAAGPHPPAPRELASHSGSLGYPLVPYYSARGGYGPGEPGYLTAPGGTAGYERDTSGIGLHVMPPEGYEGELSAPAWPVPGVLPPARGIPGADLPDHPGRVLETWEVQGAAVPDRAFPGQREWESNGARERDPRSAPEVLNRNFNIPEPRIRVNHPNPQVAHLEQRSLPTTHMGKEQLTKRAGMEHRPPNAGFEGAGGWVAGAAQVTVLPERAVLVTPPSRVSDAYNGMEAGTYGRYQAHERVDPRRLDTLDALESHRAPMGDFGVGTPQIGAHVNANLREPVKSKVYENRVSSAEFGNPYASFRGDQHTRTSENRVFLWRDGNADLPETMGTIEGTQEVVRAPKLGEAELTVAAAGSARSEAEMAAFTSQETQVGNRMERPGRVGAGHVPLAIDETSAVAAYAALDGNPYHIPNANRQ